MTSFEVDPKIANVKDIHVSPDVRLLLVRCHHQTNKFKVIVVDLDSNHQGQNYTIDQESWSFAFTQNYVYLGCKGVILPWQPTQRENQQDLTKKAVNMVNKKKKYDHSAVTALSSQDEQVSIGTASGGVLVLLQSQLHYVGSHNTQVNTTFMS